MEAESVQLDTQGREKVDDVSNLDQAKHIYYRTRAGDLISSDSRAKVGKNSQHVEVYWRRYHLDDGEGQEMM